MPVEVAAVVGVSAFGAVDPLSGVWLSVGSEPMDLDLRSEGWLPAEDAVEGVPEPMELDLPRGGLAPEDEAAVVGVSAFGAVDPLSGVWLSVGSEPMDLDLRSEGWLPSEDAVEGAPEPMELDLPRGGLAPEDEAGLSKGLVPEGVGFEWLPFHNSGPSKGLVPEGVAFE